MGILGYAFSEPQKVPIALVNEDLKPDGITPETAVIPNPVANAGPGYVVSSATVIRFLEDLDIMVIHHVDRETGKQMLLAGQVQAVVRFPKGFAADIASLSTSGSVNVTIDRSDLTRSQIMELTIRGIVQEFQREIVQKKVNLVVDAIETSLDDNLLPGNSLYPGFPGVIERLRDIRNNPDSKLNDTQKQMLDDSIRFLDSVVGTLENGRDIVTSVATPVEVAVQGESSNTDTVRDLIVPAAVGLSIFWTGTISTGSLLVYERSAPVYTRLKITPTSSGTIYGSKIILTSAIILAQTLLILIVIAAKWQNTVDNTSLTILIILLSTFASVGMGVFLASLSRDVNTTVLLSVLLTFPMLFLSGLFYPVDFMPKPAQVMAGLFPLSYTVHGLRGVMLRGFTLGDALPDAIALATFGVVLFGLGLMVAAFADRRR